jgi:hypothetical protein
MWLKPNIEKPGEPGCGKRSSPDQSPVLDRISQRRS